MKDDFKDFRIPFEKVPPWFWGKLNFIPDEKKKELSKMSEELQKTNQKIKYLMPE